MSLSKKADFSLVESLRDSLLKKVDHDYLQTASQKIKAECQSLISTYSTETTLLRKQRDDKHEERVQKLETISERYQDDLYFMKDSFKQL